MPHRIKAHHRIITPTCRLRGDDVALDEALATLADAGRKLLEAWDPEKGARFHLTLEVEYD